MTAAANSRIVLSIAIPTYNRVGYLTQLRTQIKEQLQGKPYRANIELLINDNASTDETGAFVRSLNIPGLDYKCNPKNIGGDRNFIACIKRFRGEYVWVLGDDELLENNAFDDIYEQAVAGVHDLILFSSRNYASLNFDGKTVFPNYQNMLNSSYNKLTCIRTEETI